VKDKGVEAQQELPRALETALAGCTLYAEGHPRREEALESLLTILRELHAQGKPVELDLIGGTLLLNGSPLFEESAQAIRFIDRLEGWGVHSIRIRAAAARPDLEKFFRVLSRPTGTTEGSTLRSGLMLAGVTAIDVPDRIVQETFRSAVEVRQSLTARMSGKMQQRLRSAVSAALEEIGADEVPDVETIEDATVNVAEMVSESKSTIVSLTSRAYEDQFTYNHSVNVCVLATAVAETIMGGKDDLARVAQAALLHDVGKICVPEPILYKSGRLDEQEWAIMRGHVERGAEILLRCKDIDPLSVLVAHNHHIHYAGGGYPERVSKEPQHFVVSIVKAVDVYEAMTACRPYKTGVGPDRAMAAMLGGAGLEFHPDVLRALVEAVGFYPPGSTLDLAGGEKARVIATTPDVPWAPRVAIYQDANGQTVDPTRVVTLDVTDCPPEQKIVRCRHTSGVPGI